MESIQRDLKLGLKKSTQNNLGSFDIRTEGVKRVSAFLALEKIKHLLTENEATLVYVMLISESTVELAEIASSAKTPLFVVCYGENHFSGKVEENSNSFINVN